MAFKKSLICGVAINDSGQKIDRVVNGKSVRCEFYSRWKCMIHRCYNKKKQQKNPAYAGCSVCKEWLTFSNFKRWMEKQDWQGKELDKDILILGNKSYSPESCVFVAPMVNTFVTKLTSTGRDLPMGVYFARNVGKFAAQCSNPFTGKGEHLGLFMCKDEAHIAWKKRKHELACQLADLQTDERVANALRTRYL